MIYLLLFIAGCESISIGNYNSLQILTNSALFDVAISRSTNPLDSKGLVAGDGGHVEVFGQRFRPTWTRLATSVTAGESTLELMDQAKSNAKRGA